MSEVCPLALLCVPAPLSLFPHLYTRESNSYLPRLMREPNQIMSLHMPATMAGAQKTALAIMDTLFLSPPIGNTLREQ